MNVDLHDPLRNGGPSRLDWAMLAMSLLTIAWIILAR
jgi:hypothetical protein